MLAHKSRTKVSRNTEIGGKFAHPTGNNAHQFQGQKVKGQGHQATNAETESASYLPNGKPMNFKLGDGAQGPVSSTSAMTSKVKGQGRKVTGNNAH